MCRDCARDGRWLTVTASNVLVKAEQVTSYQSCRYRPLVTRRRLSVLVKRRSGSFTLVWKRPAALIDRWGPSAPTYRLGEGGEDDVLQQAVQDGRQRVACRVSQAGRRHVKTVSQACHSHITGRSQAKSQAGHSHVTAVSQVKSQAGHTAVTGGSQAQQAGTADEAGWSTLQAR